MGASHSEGLNSPPLHSPVAQSSSVADVLESAPLADTAAWLGVDQSAPGAAEVSLAEDIAAEWDVGGAMAPDIHAPAKSAKLSGPPPATDTAWGEAQPMAKTGDISPNEEPPSVPEPEPPVAQPIDSPALASAQEPPVEHTCMEEYFLQGSCTCFKFEWAYAPMGIRYLRSRCFAIGGDERAGFCGYRGPC
jgi:hypothetical protein